MRSLGPLLLFLCLAVPLPASALSVGDCSARYRAAKESGSLGGMKWDAFRRAECGAPGDRAVQTVPNPLAPGYEAPAAPPRPADPPVRVQAPPPKGGYPAAIDPRYAGEPAGTARRKTCLDRYRADKEAGVAVAPWTERGGGYYSECARRLRG
jgi:hypothetical protein